MSMAGVILSILLLTAIVAAWRYLRSLPRRQYLNSDNVRIAYTACGTGEPVLFIHGFSASSQMWSNIKKVHGFRFIKIDCRGHGSSQKPYASEDYGLEMVKDIIRLMSRLNITRAHIVGYSMGSEIALKFATLYPECVLSMVVGGSGWSDKGNEVIYNKVARGLRKGGTFEEIAEAYGLSRLELLLFRVLFLFKDKRALAATAEAMPQIIHLDRRVLQQIEAPVLGVAAEFDIERPQVERLREALPNFTLCVIRGQDHMSAARHKEFKRAIVQFLTNQVT